MSPHCAVIETGPGVIRRLCCGTAIVDTETAGTALEAMDDAVALVNERPVAVAALWRTVLGSLDCGHPETRNDDTRTDDTRTDIALIHPSWWSPARVEVLTTAAGAFADKVETYRRCWLLARAAPEGRATVVVEIAERLVLVTGAERVAEPRRGPPRRIAERIAQVVAEMTRGSGAAVLIDAPDAISGAAALAAMVATAVRRGGGGLTAAVVDDRRLQRIALTRVPAATGRPPPGSAERACGAGVRRRNRLVPVLLAGLALAAAVPVVVSLGNRRAPATGGPPTVFLVTGRVALTVPAAWPAQRLDAGPGSARIQLTSPSDPEAALHITQAPVGEKTLRGIAESLKRALDAQPAGVFVDFDPAGHTAGRPAVTYREVRAGHDIRWTVVLDGAVRIGVGCQSRRGGEDAVREVCEQAVRSARAVQRGAN
ncbi:type VII secretion-associated protein [Mycobacterium sp. SM1]|uniref:type VII secretion-associated protein n=1 Tax=Mycobacterium sp. SM1 TaxID=2816243 RepID=UPI001BCEB19E|nr:type VII secretion-associated protein [Mycobacterium sp. SM1]MBS4728895.1 type VII secretion-associated protein [Mycobacterium sp. SM1]